MTAGLPLVVLLALFGLVIGSFLNVCIGRLPAGESIASPGSRCPSCRAPIAWYDNVPVASYLALRGRCRRCGAPISVRYPLTEVGTAAAFALQGLSIGDDPVVLVQRLVFTALLIVLFGTDAETQRLPNVITIPGIAAGFLFSFVALPGPVASLIGAALGGGILLAIRWGWKRATGVDGMGLGDVKMLAMIGAFLGWRLTIVCLFLASIGGAVIGAALMAGRKKTLQERMPFGTFLALAAYTASIVGTALLDWYLGRFA